MGAGWTVHHCHTLRANARPSVASAQRRGMESAVARKAECTAAKRQSAVLRVIDFVERHAIVFLHFDHGAGWGLDIYETGFKLQMLDLGTHEIRDLDTDTNRDLPSSSADGGANHRAAPQLAYDSGGILGAAAEISPMIAPDGKHLAFARALDESPAKRYRHRTALFIRDMSAGTERKLLDPITKDFTNTHAHYSEFMLPIFA